MSNSPLERRSYTQRRELFKGIWNATMLFDDGDATADVTVKPKIIKTLRLEQSSHVKRSIRKKRLKRLRTVCNKILSFCDHQEEDNLYSDQISGGFAKRNELNTSKIKKKKIVKKAKKSSSPSKENDIAKSADTEKKNGNIGGDDAAVPIDRARKRVKSPCRPIVKGAAPTAASRMTSKLTSTRSQLRYNSSPSPTNQQKVPNKKSRAKKKKKYVHHHK